MYIYLHIFVCVYTLYNGSIVVVYIYIYIYIYYIYIYVYIYMQLLNKKRFRKYDDNKLKIYNYTAKC